MDWIHLFVTERLSLSGTLYPTAAADAVAGNDVGDEVDDVCLTYALSPAIQ